MSKTPAISVIIPVFNMEDYLPSAITSVRSQSMQDIEIICIDDCSTDQSPRILAMYQEKDPRIKIHRMAKNSGAGPCRNKGMEMAKGDYIAFLDPDDLLAEGGLEALFTAAQDTQANIVGGNLLEFSNGDPASVTDCGKARFDTNRFYHYQDDYPFSVGFYRFIYKRSYVHQINAEFPPLRRYQDPVWFVYMMMSAKEFYGMNVPVYLYRKNHQVIAMTPDRLGHVLQGMAQNLKIFRDHEMTAHYAREQKELGYVIYRALYQSLDQGIDGMMAVTNMIKRYGAMHSDIRLRPAHIYGFIRYGLTIMKSKYNYRKNQVKNGKKKHKQVRA